MEDVDVDAMDRELNQKTFESVEHSRAFSSFRNKTTYLYRVCDGVILPCHDAVTNLHHHMTAAIDMLDESGKFVVEHVDTTVVAIILNDFDHNARKIASFVRGVHTATLWRLLERIGCVDGDEADTHVALTRQNAANFDLGRLHRGNDDKSTMQALIEALPIIECFDKYKVVRAPMAADPAAGTLEEVAGMVMGGVTGRPNRPGAGIVGQIVRELLDPGQPGPLDRCIELMGDMTRVRVDLKNLDTRAEVMQALTESESVRAITHDMQLRDWLFALTCLFTEMHPQTCIPLAHFPADVRVRYRADMRARYIEGYRRALMNVHARLFDKDGAVRADAVWELISGDDPFSNSVYVEHGFNVPRQRHRPGPRTSKPGVFWSLVNAKKSVDGVIQVFKIDVATWHIRVALNTCTRESQKSHALAWLIWMDGMVERMPPGLKYGMEEIAAINAYIDTL